MAVVEDAARVASLHHALRSGQSGEVRFDAGTRSLYANDASHFRMLPLGVVAPRTAADVAAVLATCRDHGVPVTARGAGTSLAGNAIGPGVVVDTSRHLTGIARIDPETRRAVVQPGVVLDDLRRAANGNGLTFGPDPSTANRCTLGGMLGNNACGAHSLTAGRTSDNVRRLHLALADGTVWDTAVPGPHDGALRSIGAAIRSEVAARYPDIPRRVSGWNLEDLTPDRWDPARFLVGTEGTLGVVVEAEVALVPWRPSRALATLGFPSVGDAADAVPGLLADRPEIIALEGIDALVVSGARHRGSAGTALLPDGRCWLLAEVDGDTPAEARSRAEAVAATAFGMGIRAIAVHDPIAMAALWQVRTSGLGAVTFGPDHRARIGGWEDAAVQPDRLGSYLRSFEELAVELGFDVAVYGHFGDGCVHTKIGFDHASTSGRTTFRAFVEAAAELTLAHGGSFSGEHGDGRSRSELLERMLGPEVMRAHREVKDLLDPDGILNPGVVVDPDPLDANLRLGDRRDALTRPPLPTLSPDPDGGATDLEAQAHRCIGMGVCRRDDDHGTMCPTFRVTGREEQSTRGRARLLQEALRGDGPDLEDPVLVEAMESCLSCRGCATDCPVDVDVSQHKAVWNERRWAGRRRPAVHWALGLAPWLLRAASGTPGLANGVARSRLGAVVRQRVGLTTERPVPSLAPRPFGPSWRARGTDPGPRGATVVLFGDSFGTTLDPQGLAATVRVLEAAGHRVHVPSTDLCCGRTLVDPGLLDLARRTLGRTLEVLDETGDLPIVVAEPSCASMLADEARGLWPSGDPMQATASRVADRVTTLAGVLVTDGWQPPLLPGRRAVLHGHCHQHASLRFGAEATLLDAMGLDWSLLDDGCCGLAGGYGFEAGDKYEMSVAIGESRLAPTVRALDPEVLLITDGFSCRTQLDHLGGSRPPWQLSRLLLAALAGNVPTDAPR